MRRSASRLPRILAAAAVPALLVVAGCSSGSGSGSGGGKDAADASASSKTAKASPSVTPAKYRTLPDACKIIDSKTIGKLVPSSKDKSGTAGTSTDVNAHGSCHWNGLKNKGVDGSQYRWLEVSLQRYDSQSTIGSGDAQASKQYANAIEVAQTTSGAKSVMTHPATGIGSQATTITYTLRKTGEDFSYATVVARADNVVLALTYNGAGYAGEKSPSVSDISKDAVSAAKGAIEVITSGGSGSGSGTASPSSGSSKSSSPSPSKSSGKSSAKSDGTSGKKSGAKPSGSASPSKKASTTG
ncbi:DUF3558 domain-containing protein [Streptomyces montanisoli]|uniref:DUF3558 domain-containing protein n=1 Tax=Streptomyces montanisoli TaxID=2798581 RepID=A0A940MCP0_9ACTN|nr:DUF3558 domain-containing protein [Streptomyces montanisoli]MBP0456616.1 DUF3558 domain-containing protein [Streptomyces montanisoli]